MTSASIFKDTLRNDTQMFFKFKDSIFEICLHLLNSNSTPYFLSSTMLSNGAGTSKHLPPDDPCRLTFLYSITSSRNFIKYSSLYHFSSSLFSTIVMNHPLLSLDSSSTESDVFYVQRSSEKSSRIRNNTLAVLNSTELSGAMARETITISSVASPEPRIVTIDSDSNKSTIPYAFGSQHPLGPPNLNDLNIPPTPFNVLATMAVIRADEDYSLQSPEPTIPSPISTPPMNVSTIEGWETMHTTADNATFLTDAEPRRVYWDISSSDTFNSNEPRNVSIAWGLSSTSPPPRRQKIKLGMGMSFPKKGGESQHTCGACGQPLLAKKTP